MAKTKEIDLSRVTELSSLGLTEQQIAECLGISLSTFNRRKVSDETFDTALRKGKARAIVTISTLMRECEKGSLRAIIFYLKCKAGWREEEPEIREIPPIQISVLKP